MGYKKYIKWRGFEILSSMGIPMAGFFSNLSSSEDLYNLLWAFPLLMVIAWHVIIVNDWCCAKKDSVILLFKKGKILRKRIFIAGLLMPIFIFFILFATAQIYLLAILIFVILNWHIYAFIGKNSPYQSLVHNFIGGIFHYFSGVYINSYIAPQVILPEALFFGLAMTSGGMHHEILDADEDAENNYDTGPVQFGSQLWWNLAPLPFIISLLLIPFLSKIFVYCFIPAVIAYLICFLIFTFSFITKIKKRISISKKFLFIPNEKLLLFRSLCRLFFCISLIIYSFIKLIYIGVLK